MIRRTFLMCGLMLAGVGRRAWARMSGEPSRYVKLDAPVRLPLASVSKPWQPLPFKAEATAAATGSTPGHRVILSGVLFRRLAADGKPPLSALCTTCTHEQCQVDFVEQPGQLPRMDRAIDHPVFFCACHSSVFDAVGDGAWISGPASRGLYQFRWTMVDDKAVEISEVELAALEQA